MNDLQKVQLDIFIAFKEVCEKHNLKYYLIGGTALGAVRHQGFIPWDDDLDVGMPRKDFNRLLELKDEFKFPLFLQHYKTDRAYNFGFMKLRNSNTTYVETFFVQHNINQGVWIDIFPIDGMSKKDKLSPAQKAKPLFLWLAYLLTYLGHMWKRPQLRTLWRDIPGYIVALLFSPFAIFNWLTKLMHRSMQKISYEEANLVGSFHTWSLTKEALPKKVYGEGKILLFEGVEAVVPEDIDSYLKAKYNDYMELPPENKREGHHYHYGFSLTVGYKDYIYKHKR